MLLLQVGLGGFQPSTCLSVTYLDGIWPPKVLCCIAFTWWLFVIVAVLGSKADHVLFFLIGHSINTPRVCGSELNTLARHQLSQEERDQLHYNTTCNSFPNFWCFCFEKKKNCCCSSLLAKSIYRLWIFKIKKWSIQQAWHALLEVVWHKPNTQHVYNTYY